MKKLFLYIPALMMLGCDTAKQNTMSSNNSGQDGWISLFDGKTTSGWKAYGKPSPGTAWKAVDGVLYFDAASKKAGASGGDIMTTGEFENFHLKLEWKIAPKGNSGIIFYVHEDPSKFNNTYETGPEMQVLDNGSVGSPGHPDAALPSHRAGDLYDLVISKEVVKPAGEWNAVEIIANNGQLEFYMNGQKTLSTTMWDAQWDFMVSRSKFKTMPGFGKFRRGRIALQDHGDDVWYRNIMIRKL